MLGAARSSPVLVGLLLVAAVMLSPAAYAAQPPPPTFTATLDGRDVETVDANDPARLVPDRGTVLGITVHNRADTPITVRSVRLDARVLGLTFFTYTTRVDLVVAPGATGTRTFALDIADLGDQAAGLLPARISLLDSDREVLADRQLAVDVRGGPTAVYAVFGLGTGLITALLLIGLIARLIAGLLPRNRWSRAWRFLLPGLGLGLTFTFTLSVLRLAVPSPSLSRVLVAVGAVVGLVAGYLSPSPDDGSGRDDLDADDLVAQDPEPHDLVQQDRAPQDRVQHGPVQHGREASPADLLFGVQHAPPGAGRAPETLVPGQRPDVAPQPAEPSS